MLKSTSGAAGGWWRIGRHLLLVAALLPFVAAAQPASSAGSDVQPVPPLSGRVIDTTGTLSQSDTTALVQKLASIETKRGTQIVVLIVPTTQPEDIASYGQRVGDAWKLGRRDVGDGLVIVVAKSDRRVAIEVAKSLEGAVPDVLAGRVIADQIKPAFRQNDYAGGLGAAIDRLDRAIAGEALPAPSPDTGARQAGAQREGLDLGDLAIFALVGVPIAGTVLSGIFGRKFGALATGVVAGGAAWWFTASLLLAAGAGLVALFMVGVLGFGVGRSGGFGGGPVIWGGGGGGGFGGGGGGGGGFRSGGGGDFGGGGASGSW